MRAEQIDSGLYNVDEEKTRLAVERYLVQAREYKITEYIPDEPVITAVYSDMPRSDTGVTSDSTGNLAIRLVDSMDRRRKHVERAEKAVRRLGAKQQLIIRERYMNEDDAWDHDVARKIGYSDRHYRRMKSYAIYRLANSLGLTVLKE